MSGHHPSMEVLSGHASGSLSAGAALVVACHVHGCEACRLEAAHWDAVGGELLLETPPQPLADGALESALARIEMRDSARAPRSGFALPKYLERFDIPRPLRDQAIGTRLWLAPGIWFAPIGIDSDARARTYLVYAGRNTTLPRHTHTGREVTAIIFGSFRDNLGTFDAGDFAETDEEVLHAPAVTDASECLCLINSDGPMRLEGVSAKIIQALAGSRY